MLEEITGGGIALLRAPAGYGKSTLCAAAHEQMRTHKWLCFWLTLGPEHRNPRGLRKSLRHVLGLRTDASHERIDHDCEDSGPEDEILEGLYSSAPRPTALFLDGLECLAGTQSVDCVARLAEQLPPNARLVLTSRSGRMLNLGRHQVAGNLLELTPATLRFSDEESEKFLAGRVDRARLPQIISSLDGWPVAVQQARRGAIEFGEKPIVASLLSEGPDSLGPYIDQEVLLPLGSSLQEFLACAAELNAQNAELVDAARARHDRDWVEVQLADLDPLIRLSSDAEGTFSAHPAIAARLRRLPMPTDLRRALHARAADFQYSRDGAPSAIKHLVAAGDITGAALMLERTGLADLVSDLGPPQLRSLLRLVPATAVTNLPRARIVWISMLLNDGRRDEAAAEFQRLRNDPVKLDSLTRASFASEVETLEVYFRLVRDWFPTAAELDSYTEVATRTENTESLSPLFRQQRAHFAKAIREIEEMFGIVSRSGHRFGVACLHTYRGLIEFGMGNLDSAERAYATAAASDPGLSLSAPSLMIDIPHAELYYERDALALCSEILRRHDADHECLEDWFDVYAIRLTLAARLLVVNADLDKAIAFLKSEAAVSRARALNARHAMAIATAVEILLQAGRIAEALELSVDLIGDISAVGPIETLPWRLVEIFLLTRGRLSLVLGNIADARNIADGLIERWDRIGLVRGSIRARLLAAAAATRSGSDDLADRFAFEAMDLSLRTRHLRLLLDERTLLATSLSKMLRGQIEQHCAQPLREWTSGLLLRLDAEERKAAAAIGEPLSARERDVLIGLSRGHTNKMIARSCGITANTVKHHLRQIYRKLKVNRRVQALEEARLRALIP